MSIARLRLSVEKVTSISAHDRNSGPDRSRQQWSRSGAAKKQLTLQIDEMVFLQERWMRKGTNRADISRQRIAD
jgi:hypothetical protein